MDPTTLFCVLILLPAVAGLLVLPLRSPGGRVKEVIALLVTLANLVLAAWAFSRSGELGAAGPMTLAIWPGGGLEFTLRCYQFSSFILLAAAGFSFLVTLYSLSFMKDKPYANQFYAYLLISAAMVNGAVLADNLVVLLFFWEGLLATMFGMIAIGRPGAVPHGDQGRGDRGRDRSVHDAGNHPDRLPGARADRPFSQHVGHCGPSTRRHGPGRPGDDHADDRRDLQGGVDAVP